jgi:methylated-DNA-[protein]-cysteine S-methyltransferase
MAGTDFQKSVWNALIEVPYGETSTYLQLAKDIGGEKSVRAVASANAIVLMIPCHRIIGSDGGITILAGAIKKEMSDFEKIPFSQLMPKIAKFKFRRR